MPITRNDVDFECYDRMEARGVHGIQSRALSRISRVYGADEVRAMPSFDGFGEMRAVGTR